MIHPVSQSTSLYDVQIGLTHVFVEGRDRDDAIQAARRKLCADLPRMWDLIAGIQEDRFVVCRVESTSPTAQIPSLKTDGHSDG